MPSKSKKCCDTSNCAGLGIGTFQALARISVGDDISRRDPNKPLSAREILNIKNNFPDIATALDNKSSMNIFAVTEIRNNIGKDVLIHGEGRGLNWDDGIEMSYVRDGIWFIEVKDQGDPTEEISFNLTVNEIAWKDGDNRIIAIPGTYSLVAVFSTLLLPIDL